MSWGCPIHFSIVTLRDRLPEDLLTTLDDEREREVLIVLLVSTVLLLVFFYWGRPGFAWEIGLPQRLESWGGVFADRSGTVPYLWWGLSSLVLRVGVPLGVIVWVLNSRPRDFGFRFKGTLRHLPLYVGAYLFMLPLLIWASTWESFQTYYPFYQRAAEGGWGLVLYEIGYGFQFLGVEAFFRGFMTFGLYRRFGWLAVPMMTVPYTMIHFSKPMPEAAAAILAGLILGTMAIRSKTFVPGLLLHLAVAFTMDFLAM